MIHNISNALHNLNLDLIAADCFEDQIDYTTIDKNTISLRDHTGNVYIVSYVDDKYHTVEYRVNTKGFVTNVYDDADQFAESLIEEV